MPNLWTKTTQKIAEAFSGPRTKDTEFDMKVEEMKLVEKGVLSLRMVFQNFLNYSISIRNLCRDVTSAVKNVYDKKSAYYVLANDITEAHVELEKFYEDFYNSVNKLNSRTSEWAILFNQAKQQIEKRDESRKTYDHYDEKMEKVYKTKQERAKKNQSESAKDLEFYQRNETKFKKATEEYVKLSESTFSTIQTILDKRYDLINPALSDFIEHERLFFSNANNIFRKFEGVDSKFKAISRKVEKTAITYDPCKYIRGGEIIQKETKREISPENRRKLPAEHEIKDNRPRSKSNIPTRQEVEKYSRGNSMGANMGGNMGYNIGTNINSMSPPINHNLNNNMNNQQCNQFNQYNFQPTNSMTQRGSENIYPEFSEIEHQFSNNNANNNFRKPSQSIYNNSNNNNFRNSPNMGMGKSGTGSSTPNNMSFNNSSNSFRQSFGLNSNNGSGNNLNNLNNQNNQNNLNNFSKFSNSNSPNQNVNVNMNMNMNMSQNSPMPNNPNPNPVRNTNNNNFDFNNIFNQNGNNMGNNSINNQSKINSSMGNNGNSSTPGVVYGIVAGIPRAMNTGNNTNSNFHFNMPNNNNNNMNNSHNNVNRSQNIQNNPKKSLNDDIFKDLF